MGEILSMTGGLLIVLTLKRPVWLGGQVRRYVADDTASAILSRSAQRSLGGYLIFAGALLWAFGL